jgi:very-short-patch-repair endonuclease
MLNHLVRVRKVSQERSKDLRGRQTSAEKVLWKKIRAKRFHGMKFRRQVPIGPFIVDSLQVGAKLIIEVDGDSHYEPGAQEYDRIRERYLRSKGFRIIRFSNTAALSSTEEILQQVKATIDGIS